MKSLALRRACLASAAAALSLLTLCGCGKRERATVKGTVTWAGQPLKMGMIVFVAADNQSGQGSGVIDSSGNYAVNDAPVGDVKVYISLPPRRMGPTIQAQAPGGATMPAEMRPKAAGGMPSLDAKDYPVSLPEKYKSADTTDQKFTVKPGENTFNITLTP